MILPIITAITREVFVQTPRLHEEAALALGATRWEMIRYAVFPYARSGVVSGVMLGLGRALGETMAVAMILATTPLTTLNVIGTAQPADDRGEHRPELQGGHPGAAVAADRHRPGAVRRDLPRQLRRPLDHRPRPSGGWTPMSSRPMQHLPARAPAALGARPGGARWRWPSPASRRSSPAGASSAWLLVAFVVFLVAHAAVVALVEGTRAAVDRLVTTLWSGRRSPVAMAPLVWLLWVVLKNGLPAINADFLTYSMLNVVGDEQGGILHALIGTLLITLAATVMSVPIGILTRDLPGRVRRSARARPA